MFFTVYKTTNKVNGKYYIGKHQTKNLDDGYLGSGKLLQRAIDKHGIQNFTKEILHIFDNEQDMNAKEAEIVVISEETYNLCEGGKGGFGYINKNPEKFLTQKRLDALNPTAFRGKSHTKESRRKISESQKGEKSHRFGKIGTFKGRKHSEETKKKMSKSSKGIVPWNKGKKHSEETKRKISNTLLNQQRLVSIRSDAADL